MDENSLNDRTDQEQNATILGVSEAVANKEVINPFVQPASYSHKAKYLTLWTTLAAILVLIFIFLVGYVLIKSQSTPVGNAPDKVGNTADKNFSVIGLDQLNLGQLGQLDINGMVTVNGGLVVKPSSQPTTPMIGQIYYDEDSNDLAYYDGDQFHALAADRDSVTSIGGSTGAFNLGTGLLLQGNTLSAEVINSTPTSSGVTSLQGQSGAVILRGGAGIGINGTTISNKGVTSLGSATGKITAGRGLQISGKTLLSTVSLSSASATLIVTDDGNGNYTISEVGSGSSGSVALGPALAQTDASNFPSISIDKTGIGNLIELRVGGVSRFVVGQGGAITTGSIGFSQITGLPQIVNSFTDGSLNTATGAITLGSGLALSGNTIINTASGGITAVNGTTNQVNASTNLGVVTLSLPQDIATNSTPQFSGITLTGLANGIVQSNSGVLSSSAIDRNSGTLFTNQLSVANGGTGSNNATGARTNLSAAASGANSDITSLSGLTTALSVGQGGTGATTLAQNGVLVGNGTGAISSVVAGGAGLCLTSTAGVPTWSACPGSGGVSTVNTFSGAITIQGTTNQINVANNTGTITLSLPQDINTTSSPQFSSMTLTNTLSVQGATITVGTNTQSGGLILNDGSSNTGSLLTAALGQNVVYTLPDPGQPTATICLTTGNCAGAGAGVTTSGGSNGVIPVFTASQNIENSTLSQSGSIVTASGSIVIQGASGLSLGTANGNDGLVTFYNGVGTHTVALQAPNADPVGNLVFRLPSADGSSGDCLKTNSSGVLSFGTCLSGSGGGSGGVISLNGLSGSLNLANASGAGGTITIDNATTGVKGIASFNSSFFTVSSGAVSLATSSVTSNEIANGTITGTDIDSNTVANSNLVNSSVTVSAGTGLSGGGAVSLGSSTSLSVAYGATSGTAVQGNTTINCASGTGNLTGGGTTITLGNGGSCGALNTIANPTFSTSVTTAEYIFTGAGSNGILQVGNLGQVTTYTLPDPGGASATICLSTGNCAGAGSGVTTAGGSTNTIAKFTGSQVLGDSSISDNGTTVTVGVNLNVSGAVTLSNQLTVGNGGTGATTFTSNGVLYGNGTGALQATSAGITGECLIGNTGAAPSWGSCAGAAGGVSSLNSFTGSVTIQGTTNQVNVNNNLGTITLSLPQSINTGASPQFSGLTLTGNLTAQGGSATLGTNSQAGTLIVYDGSSNTGTIQTAALGQDTTYTLPDPGVGSVNICLSTGNCAGAGSGVTTTGGSTNVIAKFTGSQTLGDSSISDNGSVVTISGDLAVNGGDITSTAGTLNINAGGAVDIQDSVTVDSLTADTGNINIATGVLQTAGTTRLTNGGILQNVTNADASTFFTGGSLTVARGGTGAGTFTSNGVLYGNGTGAILATAAGATGECLIGNTGSAPTWGSCAVAAGGVSSLNSFTGSVTIQGTANQVLVANNTGTITLSLPQSINTGASPQFSGLTLTGNLTVQGGTATVGTNSQAGSLIIYDGSSNTGTIQTAALGQDTAYTLPDPGGSTATICLSTGNCAGAGSGVTTSGGTTNKIAKFTGSQAIGDSSISDNGTTVSVGVDLSVTGSVSLTNALTVGNGGTGATTFTANGVLFGNGTGAVQATAAGTTGQCLVAATGSAPSWGSCAGAGSGVTLQAAYDNGNTISTSSARDINFTLADSTTDGNFNVTTAAGSTGFTTFALADGANASPPAQLVLVRNNDTNQAVAVGVAVQAAAGTVTTAFDASGANITNALAIGAHAITGTNFSVTGAGAVTAVGVNAGTGSIQGSGGLSVTGNSTLATGAGNSLGLGNASGQLTVTGNSSSTFVINSVTIDATEFNRLDGKDAALVDTNDAVNTAITGTGALNSGSITSGFGTIDNADTITGTTLNGTTGINTGVGAGTQRIDASGNLVNIGDAAINGGDITSTAGTLVINAGGNVDIQDAATVDSLTADTGNVAITSGALTTAGTTRLTNGGALQNITGYSQSSGTFATSGITSFSVDGTAAATYSFGASATTGTFTIGGTAQTGTITLGRSTDTNIINIGNAATGAGKTQTINIGTGGSGTSTTAISIGSTTGGTTYLYGNTFLANLNSANNASYLCQNSFGYLASCNTTGTGAAFVQGGNSYGATAVLGTNDSNSLTFETNNAVQATIAVGGGTTFKNSVDSATAFRIQNVANNNFLLVDTLGSSISIGNTGIASTIQIGNTTGAVVQTINIGNNPTSSSTSNVVIGSTIGGTTTLQSQAGIILSTLGAADNTNYLCRNTSNIIATCNAAVNTLQNAYDTDADGSDTIITLSTADDGIIIRNPSSSGSDSTYNLTIDQLATGAKGGLDIQSAGTGNLLRVRDTTATAADVLTIADGGVTTFKSQTNNANAFQIQNASSASLFNVDSTNSGNISLLGNNGAALGSWTTNSNNLTGGTNNAGTAYANGYVYLVGGDIGGVTTTVQYAKVNANGSIGNFGTATALPSAREDIMAVASNGYLYAVGGYNGSPQTTVYYTKINKDGTLSSWSTTTDLPAARYASGVKAYNGYVYIVAGSAASAVKDTYYAKQNPDGSLGSWTLSSNTFSGGGGTNLRRGINVTIANGYIYAVGGQEVSTSYTDLYYAKLNSDGSIGSWSVESDKLPAGRAWGALEVVNGYLYYYGGYDGSTSQDEVFYTALNSDGSTGAWTTNATNMLASESDFSSFSANGYLYALGMGAGDNEVHYVSTPRVTIGGSLDLVGLSGENLSEGNSGGTLTAGNTNVVGTLNVQDQANFWSNITTKGTLTVEAGIYSGADIKIAGRASSGGTSSDWSVTNGTAGTFVSNTALNSVESMVVYNGSLYIGTYDSTGGSGEIYRYDENAGTYTLVSATGLGNSVDRVQSLAVYNGYLYAGTYKTNGAEVYRYDGGTTWTAITGTAGTIGGNDTNVDAVFGMAVWHGKLYIGTYASGGVAEVYRYDGGSTWADLIATAGNICGTGGNDYVHELEVFQDELYAATFGGADICRYDGGTSWTRVNAASGQIATGGTSGIKGVESMTVFNGALYAGTYDDDAVGDGNGAIYRYDGGNAGAWVKVSNATDGTIAGGGTTNIDVIATLVPYNGKLYAGTWGTTNVDKAEVYVFDPTANTWSKISQTTAGTIRSGGTANINGVVQMIVYNDKLYAGTGEANSAEVYRFSAVKDQSYALRFAAPSSLAGATEQGSYFNEGSIYFAADLQGSNTNDNSTTGSFVFSHGITTATGSYDVAEDYPTRDGLLTPGDVVVIDEDETGFVRRSNDKMQSTIVGVYSEKPGLRLSQGDQTINGGTAVPVALAGRVPVKVSLENGPIKPGDYLTSSSIPGYAMKATEAGPSLGKALGSFDGPSGSTGKVLAFINVSYYAPPLGSALQAGQTLDGNLDIRGSASIAGNLNVSGDTSLNSLTVAGNAIFEGTVTIANAVVTESITIDGHIITAGEKPEVQVLPAGGVATEVTVDGNDTSGTITVKVPSNEIVTEGDIARLIFVKAYAKAPRIIISPIGPDSAKLGGYVDQNKDAFVLGLSTAPNSGKTYEFNYFIVE